MLILQNLFPEMVKIPIAIETRDFGSLRGRQIRTEAPQYLFHKVITQPMASHHTSSIILPPYPGKSHINILYAIK